jgi:hypothetical protein
MIIGTAEIFNCFAYLMPLLTFCLTEKEFKYCSVTSGATPNFSKNYLIALGFCKKLPSLCIVTNTAEWVDGSSFKVSIV